MTDWAVAEAKNRFSELITKALTEGPQRVRRRDDAVVVISAAEYERLTPRKDFIEHLLAFPGFGDEEIEREVLRRDPDPGRDIDL
jgi:antitoxin Phd